MAGKGVVIQIQGDGESARRALEMVKQHLRETAATSRSSASEITAAMDMVKSSLASVGLTLGIGAVISQMHSLLGASVGLGVEIGKLSKETGISSQNLSVLKYASESTGVSFEALTKGSIKLSKTMLDAEEGKKSAINSFARLGISQDEVRGKSNDLYGMLGLIADRFQQLPNGPQKAAAAMGLFSKAGAGLIPFLDQGSKGIEELRGEAESLGLVLDESGVEKMEAVHRAAVRMKGALEGAGLGISGGMAPALVGLADALQIATGRGDAWNAVGEWIGKVMIYAADGANVLVEAVRMAANAFATLETNVEKAGNTVRSTLGVSDSIRAKSTRDLTKNNEDLDRLVLERKRIAGEYQQTEDALLKALDGIGKTGSANPTSQPGDGHITLGNQSKEKSDDPIVRAAAELAQEQARAQMDAQKQTAQSMLAELDAQHKMLLVSDEEFYREKLRLQMGELDAEQTALEARQKTLQALEATQHGDKLLKRDKSGNSAEELKTQRELLQLSEALGAVNARRGDIESGNNAEIFSSNQARELAGLKAAADLEKERSGSIEAQIALIRKEKDLEAQRVTNAGGSAGDAANIRALGEVEAQKLRIGEVNRQITETENEYKRAVEELNDAAAKDPRLKDRAQKAVDSLNKQEAAQLRDLVAQYDALAATLGGPFLETARNLHAELDRLNNPDNRDAAKLTKALGEGVESMARKIADSAAEGTQSFHKMAKSIEKDAVDLAIKLVEQKYILPLFNQGGTLPNPSVGAGGGGGGGNAAGGLLASLVPSIFQPRDAGLPGLSGVLGKVAGGGGEGTNGAPNVTILIDNATGQPVSARQTGTSFDSELKQFVVHTILENAGEGGILSHLFA